MLSLLFGYPSHFFLWARFFLRGLALCDTPRLRRCLPLQPNLTYWRDIQYCAIFKSGIYFFPISPLYQILTTSQLFPPFDCTASLLFSAHSNKVYGCLAILRAASALISFKRIPPIPVSEKNLFPLHRLKMLRFFSQFWNPPFEIFMANIIRLQHHHQMTSRIEKKARKWVSS